MIMTALLRVYKIVSGRKYLIPGRDIYNLYMYICLEMKDLDINTSFISSVSYCLNYISYAQTARHPGIK